MKASGTHPGSRGIRQALRRVRVRPLLALLSPNGFTYKHWSQMSERERTVGFGMHSCPAAVELSCYRSTYAYTLDPRVTCLSLASFLSLPLALDPPIASLPTFLDPATDAAPVTVMRYAAVRLRSGVIVQPHSTPSRSPVHLSPAQNF